MPNRNLTMPPRPGYAPGPAKAPAQRLRPGLRPSPPVQGGYPMRPVARDEGGLRRIVFLFGLAFIFSTIAILSELLYYILHINTYVLYLVGLPALLGVLIVGAVPRTYRNRMAWYWTGFLFCILASVPFSSWTGDSAAFAINYIRFDFPLLFVAGGLAMGWKEVRSIFRTIAAAGVLTLITARLFARNTNGRLDLESSGSIGNPNDFASHLLFVLPFVLFVALDR